MSTAGIIFTAAAPVLGAAAVLALGALLVTRLARPRLFYFVRHGETILNAKSIRQGAEGGLSEKGIRQARAAGRYLAQFPIQKIVASTYERARETAEIINESLHLPIEYSDLLVERRNPSEIVGKHADEPGVARIVDEMDRAYHDDAYRFSDEENFEDLKDRARRALAFLSHRRTDTCVVTHGIFLKMLIAYLLYRKRLHAADYTKLSFFNASDNANVTICEYRPLRRFSATRGWTVLNYNEQPPEE